MKLLRFISLLAFVMLAFGISASAQVTVNPGAGAYTTLAAACAAINAGTHTGTVTVEISANTTETAACVINSSGAGAASYASINIFPTVDGVTVSGAGAGGGRGLIELNGADNVTIDGDNPNTGGTNRNLTINNTSIGTYHQIIRIALNTTTVTSADNNAFRNLNLVGGAVGRNIAAATSTTGTENTTYGVYVGANASGATTAPSTISSVSTVIGTGATAANLLVDNNTITSVARGVAVQGSATTVAPGLQINNNIIGNPTAGDANGVYSMGITAQGSGNAIIRGNTVYVEWFVGSANRGIDIGSISTAITAATIEKNRVTRVRNNSTGTFGAYGINLVGGNTHVVRNNFVSDIKHDMTGGGAFSTTFGVFGIRIASGTGHQIYNNSVNLFGTYTGSANSSLLSAALAVTSTTLTGIDVRNNILSNTHSSGTTSIAHVSIWLPSSATSAMNLTLNNNDYRFGTDAARQGAGQAGTTAGTTFFTTFDPTMTTPASNLRSYSNTLNVSGNDTASISVDPSFISDTDLHVAGTSPVLNLGATIASVTDDIDGDARPLEGAYEIGADERLLAAAPGQIQLSAATYGGNEGTSVVITATRTAGTSGAVSVSFAMTDGTATGGAACGGAVDYVNTGGTFNWGAGVGGSQTTSISLCTDAVADPAETFSFAISAPTGGATLGSPTSAVVTITDIPPPFSGTYTVGTGGNYPSLTNSGGIFEAVNLAGATGNITINIISDLSGELGTHPLNAIAGGSTVLIKPSGAARSITGTAPSTALIRLNGASNVTIDGSLSGGTDRSLTIENTSVTTPQVVRFGSIGAAAITANTLKNCIVINGVNTSSAVVVLDNAGTAGTFNNITIQNNDIQKAYVGVFTNATVAAGNGANLLITQNKLDTSGANAIRNVGIYVQGADGATVSNNTVGNFETVIAEADTGIWLAAGAVNSTVSNNTVSTIGMTTSGSFLVSGIRDSGGSAASGNNIIGNTVSSISANSTNTAVGPGVAGIENSSGGTTIQKNNVQGVINTNTGTYGANGINISAGNNVVVRNNFVSNVTGDMTGGAAFSTTFGIFGIRVGAGTGHQIYNNSVNLYGARTGTATSSLLTAAFGIVGTTSTGMDVRNNIFANNITGGTTSVANVSVYLPSGGTSAMNLTWNNNAYFFGTDVARAGAGQAGTTAGTNFFTTIDSTMTTPASNLRSYTDTLGATTGNDNASLGFTTAPPFVSDNDLHLVVPNTLIGAGAAIGSVSIDYDNDPRPASNPDIGADEVVQAVAGSVPAGTFYNALLANNDALAGNVTVTNNLTLNGVSNTGASTLTLGCNATVSGGGMTSYVVGNMTKQFCATGSFTYDIGTTPDSMLTEDNLGSPPEYSPFTANVTAIGTVPSALTVSVVDGSLTGSDPLQSATRYWDVTETGNLTADISFTYLNGDVNGTETGYQVLRRESGITAVFLGGTVNDVTNTGTATGVTNFSQWGAGLLAPTAANAMIEGRVATADGRGIRNATVVITGGGLETPRYVQTGEFGNYRFEDLPVGQTYVVSVVSKRFVFANPTRTVTLDDNVTGFDFEAMPQE